MRLRPRHTYDDSNPLEHMELHLKIEGSAAVLKMLDREFEGIAAIADYQYYKSLESLKTIVSSGDTNAGRAHIKRMLDDPDFAILRAWANAVEHRESLTRHVDISQHGLHPPSHYEYKHSWARVHELATELSGWTNEYHPRRQRDPVARLDQAIAFARQFGSQYGTDYPRFVKNEVDTREQDAITRFEASGVDTGVPYQDIDNSEEADIPPRPQRRRRLDFELLEDPDAPPEGRDDVD